ncbi:hypothetical protein JK636_22985 [Clostridium sp. YIM B02515]|uniref:STAS/SEC14 domain-containing protein n=1 Tax=Clostridium rhizosphaerae TaxID=2803861 RepID=A0ABS1TGR2_9CLOT|nr:hypothetical protein [Clostridium rhizosphaerae]MBL4938574.1 hypothetical protein [Clostridium rhizosphaerae]
MKKILKENLIIRNSFKLPFSGSEIWGEELDGLNIYTDVVIDKFLRDMVTIRKPSSPGLIAIHLNETLVEENLVNIIVTELKKAENSVQKVVFVGLNRTSQKLMKSSMEILGISFVYAFINDYEKAKEWLVDKKR